MDANLLVDSLRHIRVRPGFVLDYVLYDSPHLSFPVLYARPASQAPFPDWESYARAFGGPWSAHRPHYLDALETDRSPMSFFELALLVYSGDDFYRRWHGIRDDRIVCTAASLSITALEGADVPPTADSEATHWLHPPPQVLALLREMDMAPCVTIRPGAATISFVSMGDRQGVRRHRWTFSRGRSPPACTGATWEVIVPGWATIQP
jgi:hypothetical protein